MPKVQHAQGTCTVSSKQPTLCQVSRVKWPHDKTIGETMQQCGLQMSGVDFQTSYQSSKACVPNIFIKQTLVFRAVLDL